MLLLKCSDTNTLLNGDCPANLQGAAVVECLKWKHRVAAASTRIHRIPYLQLSVQASAFCRSIRIGDECTEECNCSSHRANQSECPRLETRQLLIQLAIVWARDVRSTNIQIKHSVQGNHITLWGVWVGVWGRKEGSHVLVVPLFVFDNRIMGSLTAADTNPKHRQLGVSVHTWPGVCLSINCGRVYYVFGICWITFDPKLKSVIDLLVTCTRWGSCPDHVLVIAIAIARKEGWRFHESHFVRVLVISNTTHKSCRSVST